MTIVHKLKTSCCETQIFSNVLYQYGSITFSTDIVNFFSIVLIVETANVRISVLMNSSSSLFVNLLISSDIGQVEIYCDNQLGPLIQSLLFDNNASVKHPVDGRAAIFSFPGTYPSHIPLIL